VIPLALGASNLARPLCCVRVACWFDCAALSARRESQLLKPLDNALDLRGVFGIGFCA
jgi:hypothetical protein